jgi:hypothetical protein
MRLNTPARPNNPKLNRGLACLFLAGGLALLTSCREDSDAVSVSVSGQVICSTTTEYAIVSTDNPGATLTSVTVDGVNKDLGTPSSYVVLICAPPSGGWKSGWIPIVATDSTGGTRHWGFGVVASGNTGVFFYDEPQGKPGDSGDFSDFFTYGSPTTVSGGAFTTWHWAVPANAEDPGDGLYTKGTITLADHSPAMRDFRSVFSEGNEVR